MLQGRGRAARVEELDEAVQRPHVAALVLVAEALDLLTPLDSVLLLDENTTVPTLHAVAHGDLSFRMLRHNTILPKSSKTDCLR